MWFPSNLTINTFVRVSSTTRNGLSQRHLAWRSESNWVFFFYIVRLLSHQVLIVIYCKYNLSQFSKVISRLTVVAGQVNLIDIDPTEKRESVFRVLPYETYNNVTRKDDIALIEVRYIQLKCSPKNEMKLHSRIIWYFQLSKSFTLDNTTIGLIKFNEVYTDESFTPAGTFMGWGATVVCDWFPSYTSYISISNYLCEFHNCENFFINSWMGVLRQDSVMPKLQW